MKKIVQLLLSLTLLLGLGFSSDEVHGETNVLKMPSLKAASSSTTSFSVIFTNPQNDFTDVPLNIQPSITFLYPIQWVNGATGVELHKVGVKDAIPGTATIKNNTIYFKPTKNLTSSSNYILEIQENTVKRTDSPAEVNEYYSSIFKTGTSEAPLIVSVTPYEMQTGVSSLPSIQVTFDRDIKTGKGTISLMDENSKTISGKLTISTKSITFTPNSALTKNTYFYVLIPPGIVKDTKGKTSFDYISIFQTGNSGPDPSDGKYKVVVDQSIKLTVGGGKTPYKVSTSNSKVATVKISSRTLEIKGINEGTATITITDSNKKEVKLSIEVMPDTITF